MAEQITAKEERTKFSKEKVELEVKGDKVRGALFIPEGKGPFPGVVFYHGRNSSRLSYLPIGQELAENGIVAFCFDFRGHGESEGDPSRILVGDLVNDAEETFAFLQDRPEVQNGNLGICGVSMGGDFAARIAGMRPDKVKSLILRAPTAYSSKSELGPVKAESMRGLRSKQDWQGAKALKLLSKFRGKLLMVMSQNDGLIPMDLIQEYLDHGVLAKEKEIYVIKGAGHYLGDANSPFRQEFKRVVVDWFRKTLLA